jgi:hypothetical protein
VTPYDPSATGSDTLGAVVSLARSGSGGSLLALASGQKNDPDRLTLFVPTMCLSAGSDGFLFNYEIDALGGITSMCMDGLGGSTLKGVAVNVLLPPKAACSSASPSSYSPPRTCHPHQDSSRHARSCLAATPCSSLSRGLRGRVGGHGDGECRVVGAKQGLPRWKLRLRDDLRSGAHPRFLFHKTHGMETWSSRTMAAAAGYRLRCWQLESGFSLPATLGWWAGSSRHHGYGCHDEYKDDEFCHDELFPMMLQYACLSGRVVSSYAGR